MYNRIETILEAYPYTFTDIRKGRGAWICTEEQGQRMVVKEFSGTPAKAEKLCQFLTYLKDSGWTAEQMIPTAEEGLLYTGVDDTKFYMCTLQEGRECDTRSREELIHTVRRLAEFHILTADCGLEETRDPSQAASLLQEYERHTKELRKVYNYARGRKNKNEFETAFLKEYRHYLQQAEEAQDRLKSLGAQPKETYFGICHGDFHQHNVLCAGKKIVFINYEHFCVDAYISDFANFFRKIMEKHSWNTALGMDLVDAYDKVRPLGQWERKQLYLRMAYPEKFRKVVNHYFNSRKNWANHRDAEKLEKISGQEKERTDFLKILFYFVGF